MLLGPLPPAPRAVPVSIQTGPRLTRQTGPQVLSDLIEGPRTRGWGGVSVLRAASGAPGTPLCALWLFSLLLPAPTPAPGQALSLPDPSVRRASLLTAGAELPPRQPPRERAALDGTRMSPCRPRLCSRSSPATPPDHRRGAVGGAGGRVFPPPLPPASSLLASLSTSCKCRVHMTQERSSRVWFSGLGRAGRAGHGMERKGKGPVSWHLSTGEWAWQRALSPQPCQARRWQQGRQVGQVEPAAGPWLGSTPCPPSPHGAGNSPFHFFCQFLWPWTSGHGT